jgi:hypothetical protein
MVDIDLTRLTDAQLENLEDFCTRKGRDDLYDLVIDEMFSRPNFSPSSYELMCYLYDCGWNGGQTQEEIDAR